MAKLPTTHRIRREDLKDAPEWSNKLLQQINTFFEAIYNAVNGGLSFGENVTSTIRDINFTTPSDYASGNFTNLTFERGFDSAAKGVVLLQIIKNSSGGSHAVIRNGVSIDWLDDSGVITIYNVSGLENSTTYDMRVMVI